MIGISGVAKSGKDTLYFLLKRKFKEKYNKDTRRYALADSLKQDLRFFIINSFNIDLENLTPQEKELVRPIMVTYGKAKRSLTSGRHWISILEKEIESDNSVIPIITDIRYCEYKDDECSWILNEKNGFLIHVSRLLADGRLNPPANEEESLNDKILINKASFKLNWFTEPNNEILYKTYNQELENICSEYERSRSN